MTDRGTDGGTKPRPDCPEAPGGAFYFHIFILMNKMDQRAGLAPRQDPGGRCGDLVARGAGCAAAPPAGPAGAGEQGVRLRPHGRGPQGLRESHYLFGGFCQRQVRCLERARRTRYAAGMSLVGPPRLAAPNPFSFSVSWAGPPARGQRCSRCSCPPPATKGLFCPRPEPARVWGRTQAVYSSPAARWRPPSSPRSERPWPPQL